MTMFGIWPQVGEVEDAVVRRPVVADEAGAIEREDHRQPLEADVVQHLVEGALQEGRVDGDHRAHPLAGETGGEGHRVLLGDADVEEALRVRGGEGRETGPVGHRGGDRDQALLAGGLAQQRLAEDRGVRWRRRSRDQRAGGRVERADPVVAGRVALGRRVALALLGDHVHEDRLPELLADVAEGLDEVLQVVAGDRADVPESELLEEQARNDQRLDRLLDALGELGGLLADAGGASAGT